MKKIIFLCTGNSCRSQMAEGFARSMLLGEKSIIDSAGVRSDGLNKLAIKVMKEIGIDISDQKSQSFHSIDLSCFDLIVTVCDHAHNTCPIVHHNKIIHKSILDPALVSGTVDKKLVVYRKVRDEIRLIVMEMLKKYNDICQEPN